MHHRAIVIACLVQGVYVQDRDRQQNRQGPQALGPPWWLFFQFQLNCQLMDNDGSIFGAIYELVNPAEGAPTYVIAFRGTNKGDSLKRDLKLDLLCFSNGLHRTSRYVMAMQIVRNRVAAAGSSNVWLAGHSLGAAIGMLVGKNMAKMGIFLKAFLFNPPFILPPIEWIKSKNLKHMFRIVESFITAAITVAMKGHRWTTWSEDPFVALSSWVPYLFVNRADFICSGYIGYFEHREVMEAMGVGWRLAIQNSLWTAFFTGSANSEPLHLLPSANLTMNLCASPAHGICQWWAPDLHFDSKEYIYSSGI